MGEGLVLPEFCPLLVSKPPKIARSENQDGRRNRLNPKNLDAIMRIKPRGPKN